MAEGTGLVMNQLKYFVGSKQINLKATDVLKVILCTGTNPTSPDGSPKLADAGYAQPTMSGYTAGGQTISSRTYLQYDATDTAEMRITNPTWTALFTPSAPVTFAALYLSATGLVPSVGGTVDNPILATWELSATDHQPNGGDYTLSWSTAVAMLKLT